MVDMQEFWKVVFSLLAVILLGLGGGRFLDAVTKGMKKRAEKYDCLIDWEEIPIHPKTGEWLGFLERLISLIAFWINAHVIIAAWLAFKVAAKWEIWKNIIQVPPSLKNVSEKHYLMAKNAWGTWLLNRFLIGTLINVLIGFVAYGIGKNLFLIIDVMFLTATKLCHFFLECS